MSVLIKGMEMPKDCYSCPFTHDGWPDEWEMHCLFLDRQVGYFGKKLKVPKDCPLVEVSDPCAQSEQRWIPCSERLPEDLEEVNVTWVNHAPEQYYDFVKDKHFTGSAVYYKGSWYWYSSACVDILAEYGRNEMDKIDDGIEVVAWMPLPEPYKEEV